MKLRNILIVAVIIIAGIYFYNRYNDMQNSPEPVGEITSGESIEDEIEQILGREIADDIPKAEISNETASAIVTYDSDSEDPIFSVLADLPDTEDQYEVKISNGEEDLSFGELNNVKGGYLLETSIQIDPNEYNIFEISTPNETVLQGILEL